MDFHGIGNLFDGLLKMALLLTDNEDLKNLFHSPLICFWFPLILLVEMAALI